MAAAKEDEAAKEQETAKEKEATKQYPMLEIAKHNTAGDCWLVIHGKVVNVTRFLDEHPGGEDVLIESAGADATRQFEDVGHSSEARAQLEELVIGTLREPTEEEKRIAQEEALQRGENIKGEKDVHSAWESIAKWLFPIVLIGIAYLVRKYT